ncbi:hypothetical protein LINPERPRIM_LOCUS4293 [Linum perenne]
MMMAWLKQNGISLLKAVEIVGFSGYAMKCRFLEYAMAHFVGLERIVIDRRVPAHILAHDGARCDAGRPMNLH